MDYHLENKSMGMSVKNRELFADIGGGFSEQTETKDQDKEHDTNTYQMYSSFIKEKDGLIAVIKEICAFSLNPQTTDNKNIKSPKDLIDFKNRTIMILSSYQEQPGLLDPILPLIIPIIAETILKLIDLLLKEAENKTGFECLTCLCQLIYIVCKVRGFSTIAKFFSSEVAIFENVIEYLFKQPYENIDSWYVNYVLVLWTSILAMVPFDIDTIDTKGSLISKLIEYLKEELTRSTNLRIITAYSISKFLTRPDLIKKEYLSNYIKASTDLLFDKEKNNDIFKVLGIVLSLCEIFKNGQPKDLIQYVDIVISKVLPFEFPDCITKSGVFRKSLTKLIQRVGLVILKPKAQKWRYHQEVETLFGAENEGKKDEPNENQEDEIDQDLDEEQGAQLETIIGYLIEKLSDKEYIVRWSGAKGLGRICERLTKAMVEDILHSILDLFKDKEDNEFDWHGACLSIAELCKRGMILPERLDELVPYLQKALIFETNKGTFVAGANVRDSACYIVWALARGYSTDIMKNHVDKLAQSLILTILFDKEVNCRRAASAAFQENIGRQGNFPHGIEILTEADYFTLGTRANCYLNISTFICQYDTYFKTIVDYLSFDRLVHIERQIRELASDAIGLLVPFNPQYFIETILPKMIQNCFNPNLSIRHGSLIGIGNILMGLKGKWDFYNKASINRKKMLSGLSNKEKQILQDSEYRKKFEEFYTSIKTKDHFDLLTGKPSLVTDITSLVSNIDKKGLYKGKGNEVMRNGVNAFIKLISEVHLPISGEDFVFFHEILIENIRQNKAIIQEEACETLRRLNEVYSKEFAQEESVNAKVEKLFLDVVKQSVDDDSVHVTRGYTAAIVNFNSQLILKHYDLVISSLIKSSKLKNVNNDSLTRRSAIDSIGFIIIKFINEKFDDIEMKIKTIIEGFDDYEMDPKMGDVGSNVRMKCVDKIIDVMLELHSKNKKETFDKHIVTSLKCVIKQLAEKMASVRRVSGNAIQRFFYELKDADETHLKEVIPNYTELKNIFVTDIDFDEYDKVDNIKWVEPEFAYKKIMPIVTFDTYADCFIEGLIRSIACITEDVQKCSVNELKKVFESEPARKANLIKKFFQVIIDIFTKKERDDRFIEPLESALVFLFSMNYFINNDYIEYFDKIHKAVLHENVDSKNIHKILYSTDIYYNMLFLEKEDKYKLMYRCMRSLLFQMCHKYPVVRKKASEKFFIFLSGLDDPSVIGIDEEKMEEANLLLADTDWTQKVAEIKEVRNNLANILGIKF